MAWTAPKSWYTGELVTASMLNTHIKDNELYLYGSLPATRYLWVPARDFNAAIGAPTYTTFGDWPHVASGWVLLDAVSSTVVGHVALPADYVAGTPVKLYLLYQGGGSGNFRVTCQWANITANGTESMADTDDVVEPKSIPSHIETYLPYFSNMDITPNAGDFLNIGVARDGTHAEDTSPDAICFFGVRLAYTAKVVPA